VNDVLAVNDPAMTLDADDEAVVERELLRMLATRLFLSSRTSFLGYGAMALFLRDVVAPKTLVSWLALIAGIEAINCLVEWRWLQSIGSAETQGIGLRILSITIPIYGLLWGATAVLPGVSESPWIYVVVLLFLGIVAVVSIHNLCFRRSMLTAFTACIAIPLVSSGIANPSSAQGMLGLSASVFFLVLQFYGNTTYKMYVHDIRSTVLACKLAEHLRRANDELKKTLETVKELANHDPLTHCLNRRAITAVLKLEASRAKRYGQRFGVILFDLDHFKSINDRFGHGGGDAVLVAAAAFVRGRLRNSDSLARWGGEEFLCLVLHTTEESLRAKAQDLCDGLASTPLVTSPQVIPVSASFGLALSAPDSTIEALIERADAALYRAKEAGRNRVCI